MLLLSTSICRTRTILAEALPFEGYTFQGMVSGVKPRSTNANRIADMQLQIMQSFYEKEISRLPLGERKAFILSYFSCVESQGRSEPILKINFAVKLSFRPQQTFQKEFNKFGKDLSMKKDRASAMAVLYDLNGDGDRRKWVKDVLGSPLPLGSQFDYLLSSPDIETIGVPKSPSAAVSELKRRPTTISEMGSGPNCPASFRDQSGKSNKARLKGKKPGTVATPYETEYNV